MKTGRLWALLVSLLMFTVFLSYTFPAEAPMNPPPDVFFGVDVAYENLTEIKALIDEVSPYTNFFGIGCTGVTNNITKLDEVCQYIYDKCLRFIVYTERPLRLEWLENAKNRWGEYFLGFYFWDENGGKQLDLVDYRAVLGADNYTDASNQFVSRLNGSLARMNYTDPAVPSVFTSDYALYWFDYKAGYDVVLAQLGWNYSRQLNIALCRGAATMQSKEWGVIVTWTYTVPPYIGSGEELYNDLVLAYENGATYISVFDSNENYTQGILQEEHLQALRQFWQYVQNNPRTSVPLSDRVAFVLPDDYAYGFRGPEDRIWGLWEADELSLNISVSLNSLFEKYGTKLDIIYDDGRVSGIMFEYSKLVYWNDPSLSQQSVLESPSTPIQTPTSTSIETPSSVMDYVPLIAAGAVITAVAVPAFLLRKRQYTIIFALTGIGADFEGTVITIDGQSYDRYGASFYWGSGSHHTFEFKSPIVVSHGKQNVKQYVLTSTTGLATGQNGLLEVSMPCTVTGNYTPVYKIDYPSSVMTNRRLKYA
jgi:hypothetical protein